MSQTRSLRVLLVEDNEFSRRVAAIALERLGHQVVAAGDGHEALALLAGQPFDLVLLDLQMPVLDGVETARLLRQREEGTGRHLPILALTANAFEEDRERCREAGIDGYLSKPIEQPKLAREIRRLLRWSDPDRGKPDGAAPLVRPEDLLARMGGNTTLLRQMIDLFQAEAPQLLATLRAALRRGDAALAERTAHTLKSSAGLFAGHAAVREAALLEQQARNGDLTGADGLARLEQALADLCAALAELQT